VVPLDELDDEVRELAGNQSLIRLRAGVCASYAAWSAKCSTNSR